MVSDSRCLPAAVFVFATYHARHKPAAQGWRSSPQRPAASASAGSISFSRTVLALAALRKLSPPTIRAWECVPSSPTLDPGEETAPWVKTWHGSNSAFRCWSICSDTTGPLAALGHSPSLWGCAPPAPGNSSFLLRQRPQESVLLSRLRARRRSDPLCRTFLRSAFSPKRRPPGAGTGTLCARFRVTAANSSFLSASAPLPPRGDSISETAWIARSHPHRSAGPRLCSRR